MKTKIKNIWDKFLELRKSPVCALCAAIGLMDIFGAIYLSLLVNMSIFVIFSNKHIPILDPFFQYLLYTGHFLSRSEYFAIYMTILVIAFLIERKLKIQLASNGYIERSRLYKMLWFIGIMAFFLIVCLYCPIAKEYAKIFS